jgi:hypothetical protein
VNVLTEISERLKTQDNRCTADPMFCVQMLVRDVGFDTSLYDNRCWHNYPEMETVYDDDPDFKGEPEGPEWEEFAYRDRWENVMVAFTEEGCKQYLALDGHNVRRRAFRRQVRIYVESFYRCPEMIAIREFLMDGEASK